MNFDFLEAIKSLDKDKPCLDYLSHEASYSSGWNKFIYEGCKALEILLNPELRKMKVRGSIPYFTEGQNFNTSIDDFKKGIIYLSEVLNLDLMKAEANVFEFGTVIEIPFPPKEVFYSHLKIRGMKTRSFDYGKYFEDRILKVKLYDAGKNMKNKLTKEERNKLSLTCGYNPFHNYLKIENHYKKPLVCFKQGIIKVNDLIKPEFQNMCKGDLLTKYKSIMKSNSVEVQNKKQLTSSTIPLLVLKEYEKLLPMEVEELIKLKIKSFPVYLLGKEDKKARKRQIMNNMKKVRLSGQCVYDISDVLEARICSINN